MFNDPGADPARFKKALIFLDVVFEVVRVAMVGL